MKSFISMAMLVFVLAFGSGCGTITHGTHETMEINSNPQMAKVTMDGRPCGFTPALVEMSRGWKNHEIVLELDGYETAVIETSKEISWLCAVLGLGTYGVSDVIDMCTGAIFDIQQIHAVTLVKKVPTVVPVAKAKAVVQKPVAPHKVMAKAQPPAVVQQKPVQLKQPVLPDQPVIMHESVTTKMVVQVGSNTITNEKTWMKYPDKPAKP